MFGEQARKLVFGSTKSMTGHLLGAAGALEFGVSLLATTCGIIPPTINQFNPDPECDLDCAPNRKVEREVDVAHLQLVRIRRAQRHARGEPLQALVAPPASWPRRAAPV